MAGFAPGYCHNATLEAKKLVPIELDKHRRAYVNTADRQESPKLEFNFRRNLIPPRIPDKLWASIADVNQWSTKNTG